MMQLITADHFGNFIDEIAEMHRLRYRVFRERLDWEVQVSGDMEIDEFDALQPCYLLLRAGTGLIQGCVRLLPSIGATMLRDTFPILLDGAPAPKSRAIWESSRFALDLPPDTPKATHGLATATYELFASDLPEAERTKEVLAPRFGVMNLLPIPWVEPVDISNAVLWLASDESRYVTGVTLPIDAGLLIK